MLIFRLLKDKIEIEKKWLPEIAAQLKAYNEATRQQTHDLKALFQDIKRELSGLAKNEAEFIEVIRHFFAVSRELQIKEQKRLAQAEEDLKPGKHDDRY